MLTGTWDVDGVVAPLRLDALIDDDTRPQQPVSWSAQMSMQDHHPLSVSSSPYTTLSLEWPAGAVATSRHASVLNGGVARAGTRVACSLTDGAQTWPLLPSGRIDDNTGQATSPGHSTSVVDNIDVLEQPISLPAVFASMTQTTGPRRRVGMCATWQLDRVLRKVGFAATPPSTSGMTRLAVTMMGSMWPDTGVCRSAGRMSDTTAQPRWTVTPWGMAVVDGRAVYALPGDESAYSVTLDLVDQTSATAGKSSVVQVLDASGRNGVYVGQTEASVDSVVFGVIDDGSWIALNSWIPRNGADRVRLRMSRTSNGIDLRLTVVDGREEVDSYTTDTPGWSGWVADQVIAEAGGAMGGFVVDHWPSGSGDALHAPRYARHRLSTSTIQWWSWAPALVDVTARSVLNDMSQQECASWWLGAADGVLTYAHRGVLEGQSPAWTKTSALLVDDISWRDDIEHLASTVTVTGSEQRRILGSSSLGVHRHVVTAGINSDRLVAGERRTDTYTIPDDEDYAGIDLTGRTVTQTTTRRQMLDGTIWGGTHEDTTSDSDSSESAWTLGPYAWMLNHRTIAVSYTVDASLPSTVEIALETPPAHPTLPESWRGKPLPIIRAMDRGKFTDADPATAATGLSSALPARTHDAGRTVVDADRRSQLATWLADVHGAYRAVVTVDLDHDPRVQVGDVGTIRDEHRQHVELDMLVTGIRCGSGRGMTVEGRVLATRGLTVPAVPADWSDVMSSGGWGMAPPPGKPMRHVLVLHSLLHESGKLLVNATQTDANLSDPTNTATISRLVSRYDTIVMQDAWWTPVPRQVAEAIRAESERQARPVRLLRYVDAAFTREADTGGTLGIIPLSEGLNRTEWLLHNPDGSLKRAKQGNGYFPHVGSSTLRARAVDHLLTLVGDRSLWDGIFLDDVVPNVDVLQVTLGQNCTELPWTVDRSAQGYQSESEHYEAAMKGMVQHVTAALAQRGIPVMGNLSPGLVGGRDFATGVATAATALTPFLEIYATGWEGQKITRPADPEAYDWYWRENHLVCRARVKQWESEGRAYVVNGHANSADPLGYALSGWLPWWRGSGLWCGAKDDGTGYNSEPVWIAQYDRAPTSRTTDPAAQENTTTGVVTRTFPGGPTITWNPVAGTWSWT